MDARVGSPPFLLPLKVSARSRILAFGRALFPLSIGLGILIASVSFIASGSPIEEGFGALLLAFHAGPLAVMLALLMMKPAFVKRPHVRIEERGLTINHWGVFRLPLAIPWAMVRLTAVTDDPPRRRFGRQDTRRFRLSGDAGAHKIPEFLYSRDSASAFPVVSHAGDPPNVALIFARPIPLWPARRTTKVLAAKGPVHIARPRQITYGLLLRVADPELARRAFGRHGLVDHIGVEDLMAVAPGPEQRDRARARNTRANLIVAGIITINMFSAPLAGDIGPADPPRFDEGLLLPSVSGRVPPGREHSLARPQDGGDPAEQVQRVRGQPG